MKSAQTKGWSWKEEFWRFLLLQSAFVLLHQNWQTAECRFLQLWHIEAGHQIAVSRSSLLLWENNCMDCMKLQSGAVSNWPDEGQPQRKVLLFFQNDFQIRCPIHQVMSQDYSQFVQTLGKSASIAQIHNCSNDNRDLINQMVLRREAEIPFLWQAARLL